MLISRQVAAIFIIGESIKKKLVARWRPFWLSVKSWKSNQVISILMGNFT